MTDAGFYLVDAEATERAGAALAGTAALAGLQQIHLYGDLGAGKTTLVRGFLRALGHRGSVRSPTYTLLESYEFPDRTVLHFDLYRVADPEELEYLGVREQSDARTLWLVEWPEQGQGWLSPPDLVVTLLHEGEGRRLRLSGPASEGMVKQMKDL